MSARQNTECGHVGAKHYARGHCRPCYSKALKAGEFDVAPCVTQCGRNASGSSEFCRPCGERPAYLGLPLRFWHYVKVADDVPSDDPCWVWIGHRTGRAGAIGGPDGAQWSMNGEETLCTRTAFWAQSGRWPDDLLTHTCRGRCCVNPSHLVEVAGMRDAIDNQRALPRSGFRGVERQGDRWVARRRVGAGAASVRFATFDTPEEAYDAYRSA